MNFKKMVAKKELFHPFSTRGLSKVTKKIFGHIQ